MLETRREKVDRMLTPLQEERRDIDRGIKVLEKAIAAGDAPRRGRRPGSAGKPGAKKADVLAVLVEHREEGLTRDEIAEKLGTAQGLHFTLPGLVSQQLAAEVGGKWKPTGAGLKQAIGDAHDEAEPEGDRVAA